ncbi:MAG: 50S ribosomal protein L29 [Planctomycetota bacterium]|nr:MAG: 50S ribosomal protein L29 [Planctomycetota bacterium]
MNKVREIREMSDEQIRLVWKDCAEKLFKLRIQSQTEKLPDPTGARKIRRTIARCQTILAQRGSLVVPTTVSDGAPADQAVHDATQHEKHAQGKHLTGRAKVHVGPKGAVRTRRKFQKRTQSGK